MISRESWEKISLHIWLIMSSFGIMFAVLSFCEDLNILDKNKQNNPWVKGVLSVLFGMIFYVCIGLPHLNGAKNRSTNN